MAGVTRWKPPRLRHVYPVPGGYREYRHGWQGYSWAVVTPPRMARLCPQLGAKALPDPAAGGVIPDGPPAFYAVRLDCRGRLDRLCGSAATAEKAREACADDAGRIADYEARHFGRTGRRPAWPKAPSRSPAVLRRDRFAWRLRRLAGMAVRTHPAILEGRTWQTPGFRPYSRSTASGPSPER